MRVTNRDSLSRRNVLKAVGVGGVTGLSGCLGGGEDSDGESNSISDLDGTSLQLAVVTQAQEPLQGPLQSLEDEYGIEVELTGFAVADILPNVMNQLRAQEGGFDLFMTDVMWTGSFMEPELVEPIDDYLENDDLMIEGYDYDDHLDVYAETLGTWNGTTYGLPFWGDALRMPVRKDVLEEHADEYRDKYGSDILPPVPEGYESYEEYNQVAEFMSEKGWPIGLEAKRGMGIPYHYANRFAAATGEQRMLNDDKQPKLDSSGAADALDNYLTQLQWAQNPRSTGFTEGMNQFVNGDTWAHETWTFSVAQSLAEYDWEDELRLVMPPGGNPCLGGFGFLINSFVDQRQKDAAFVAAQHLTSKEVDKELFRMGLGATRASSHTEDIKEEVPQARYTDPEENPGIKTMSVRPNVPKYAELSDAMSVQFSEAFGNPEQVDPAQVTQSVHSKWSDILSNS